MCLLTFFPDGVIPNSKTIEGLVRGAKFNPDGHGYAMITGDSVTVGKGMDPDEIIEQFLIARHNDPSGPALFHSRIGTDGSLSEENCHPFYIGNDKRTVLAHNGILPRLARPTEKHDQRSDTRILAETLLPEKPFGYFRARLAREAFEEWLGTFNKVVILTTNPRYPTNALLFNERSGTWDDGVWWSNDSYLPFSKKVGTTIYLGRKPVGKAVVVEDDDDPVSLSCIECKEPAVDKQYRVCWNCSTCQDCLGNYTKGECLCYVPSRGSISKERKAITQASTVEKMDTCPGCSKDQDNCLCCEI